ncbi:hypothetical protein I546_0064 [Mycobacterium kansasii 732]|nr:hypothetical protein I546_0064 [Mycobacterium kansasii 732]
MIATDPNYAGGNADWYRLPTDADLLRRERRSRRLTPAIADSTYRRAIHIDIAIFLC